MVAEIRIEFTILKLKPLRCIILNMKFVFPFLFVLLVFSCASAKHQPGGENFIADADPFQIASTPIMFTRIFSSQLAQRDVPLTFIPRTNEVYLQFSHETLVNRQFWDRNNREKLISAVTQYLKDFDERRLNRNARNSDRAYGVLSGKLEWGQFAFAITMNSRSFPQIHVGYQFVGNTPYFTITQRDAEDTLNGDSRRSLRMTLFFTRAQAAELASFFDQDFILGALEEQGVQLFQESERDVY